MEYPARRLASYKTSALLGVAALTLLVLGSLTGAVHAQTLRDQVQGNLEYFGGTEGAGYDTTFSEEDIYVELLIVQIISFVLGFLGVIFLILILYAGILWMTSNGDEKRIEKAKKTIMHATIGLAIVLLSFAITRFVYGQLAYSTTSNPS